MNKINDIKLISLSYGLSSLGCAISNIFIPLFIYNNTQSALLTALQLTAVAVGNLIACHVVNSFKLSTTDKISIIYCSIISAIIILLPVVTPHVYLIPCLYLISLLSAFIDTCWRGYNESFIGSLCLSTDQNRQNIIGKIKFYENFGLILGTVVSIPLMHYSNYHIAFCLNAITFFIAASFIGLMNCNGTVLTTKPGQIFILNILFKPKLKMLTISHSFAAVGLFLLNGSVIYILKNIFNSSNEFISFYYISQFIFSTVGALLIAKLTEHNAITIQNGPYLRFLYAIPFIFIAIFHSLTWYMFMVSMLALIHSFSLPVWQSLFQELAEDSSEWKVIGSTRKTLVSIVGGVTSIIVGLLLDNINYHIIYFIAGICCIISTICLMYYKKNII